MRTKVGQRPEIKTQVKERENMSGKMKFYYPSGSIPVAKIACKAEQPMKWTCQTTVGNLTEVSQTDDYDFYKFQKVKNMEL